MKEILEQYKKAKELIDIEIEKFLKAGYVIGMATMSYFDSWEIDGEGIEIVSSYYSHGETNTDYCYLPLDILGGDYDTYWVERKRKEEEEEIAKKKKQEEEKLRRERENDLKKLRELQEKYKDEI